MDLLADMTDEELAGQLLVVAVHGGDVDEVTEEQAAANRALYGVDTPGEVVDTLEPAGVILLGGNTSDTARVPAFVAALQERSASPLLVAVDQEHGPVTRLGDPFTRFPSAMALGATADPDLVRRVAAAAAAEMSRAGLNVNLAPVADVNTEPRNPVIGIRSFGERSDLVARMVAAQVRGLQQGGEVAAAVKHFPGHGDTTVDSHDALPTVDASLAGLRDGPLEPFEAAIASDVAMVMAGHLLLPSIDPDDPAPLSPALVRGLLRDELGFDGIVVTDSMWMGAIRGDSAPATSLAALAAGVDLVLMSPDAVGTRDAIVDGLADGTVDRARIEESVARVLRLKHRLGLFGRDLTDTSLPDSEMLAAHDVLAVEAAARAVTVVAGDCPTPLRDLGAVAVDGDHAALLADHLSAAGIEVTPDADVRVRLWDGRGQPPADPEAIVVVTSTPYVAGEVDDHRSLLVAYDHHESTLRGVALALGRGDFEATLPVTIPDLRTVGDPGAGPRCR